MRGGSSPSGRVELRARRRVEERVRGQAALGRELDDARLREVRGGHGRLDARAKRLQRARRDVDERDLGRHRRRPGHDHRLRAVSAQTYGAPHESSSRSRLSSAPVSGSSTPKCVKPLGVVRAHDAPVREERERARPERPRRVSELGLRRVERRRARRRGCARGSTSRCDRSRTRDRPHGLHSGCQIDSTPSVPATCSTPVDRAVRRELRDVELAAVPRHPRQIPREEAEPRAVRRDARRRVEVATADDHARLGGSVRRQDDELVHDVLRAVALGVSLAHADPERAVGRDAAVGVAVASVSRSSAVIGTGCAPGSTR